MVFVCDLLLKEANIYINSIRFDRNFDHPHVNVVTFVPENSPKSHNVFPQQQFFVDKVFDMYLLLGLSTVFSQSNLSFLKNCQMLYLIY